VNNPRRTALWVLALCALITFATWLNFTRLGYMDRGESVLIALFASVAYGVCAFVWLGRSETADLNGLIVSIFLLIATLLFCGPFLVQPGKPDPYFDVFILFYLICIWGTLIIGSLLAKWMNPR
jgi:hypothetical protein